MEKEKRKRAVDDGRKDSKKRGKPREDDGANTTEMGNDEEVEEFYAILRRIKVAVKYFQKGSEGQRAKGSSLWSPTFEWEDFKKAAADDDDDGGVKSGKEGVEDNVGLDLNAEPDPESDPDYC